MSKAQQILNASKYSSFDDMAEAWLGDWTSQMTDAEAYDLAAKCEDRQQHGDDRDYCEIVKCCLDEIEAAKIAEEDDAGVNHYRVIIGEKGNEQGHVVECGNDEAKAKRRLAHELAKYNGDGWGRVEIDRNGSWDRL